MSIDARVKTVIIEEDGTGRLDLIDRPGKSPGISGQSVLYFRTAPEEVTALSGLDIWGGSSLVMLGDNKIADRSGYCDIRFVDSESP